MYHMGCIQSIQFQGLSFHLLPVSIQTSMELCAAPKSPSPPDAETSLPGPETFSSHPRFSYKENEIVPLWQFCCCASGENFMSAEISEVLFNLEL